MNQSIENIWKQGFVKEELVLPSKVNNIYTKRSNLLVGKLRRTLKWDNLSLIPLGLICFIYFFWAGKLIVGIYGTVLIAALFFLNQRHLNHLLHINERSSCHHYLVSLQLGIVKIKKFYNRLLAIAVPLTTSFGIWLYYLGEKPIEEILTIVLIICIVMPLGSIAVYRISNRMLYGAILKKLEQTIQEMEELSI